MKTLILALALVLALAPSLGHAQDKRAQFSRVVTALNAVALNAGASALTFAVSDTSDLGPGYAEGYEYAIFFMHFDYTAQAGAISLTCTGGPSSSDVAYRPTVVSSVSSGTGTVAMSGVLTTASLSADTKWWWVLRILGARDLSCVVAHGGTPGATDKITVKYQLMAR